MTKTDRPLSRRGLLRSVVVAAGIGTLAPLLQACATQPAPNATPALQSGRPTAPMPPPPSRSTMANPSGQPSPEAVTPSKAAATQSQLQFWSRFEFMKEATAIYNDGPGKSSSVSVVFTTVPGGQFVEKLTTAIASKTAPDVCSLDVVQCPYYNSVGAFVDITARFKSLTFADELAKGMLQLGEYQDKQYQFPLASDNSALLWNKALFKSAELDPEKGPVLWSEYVDSAKAITKGDVYGTAYISTSMGGYIFRWLPFVWSNGGDVLSPDGNKPAINSPQALEALQLWVDMIYTHKATPSNTWNWSTDDVIGAFKAKKIGMIVDGNATIARLKREAPEIDFGTTLIPKPRSDAKHASFGGGDNTGILSQSKDVDHSWQLIQFLLSDQVQVEYLAKTGVIPIRTSFYNNTYFQQEPRYQAFTKSLDVARAIWSIKYNRLFDSFTTNLQAALAKKKTAQDALAEMASSINKVLAE